MFLGWEMFQLGKQNITIDSNLQLLLPSIGKEISIPIWSPWHWFMYVQIVVYLWAPVPPFREDFALCWESRFPVQQAYTHQIMLVYGHRASSITITFLITSLQIRTDLHSSQEMSEEVNHHRRIACEQCYKQPFFQIVSIHKHIVHLKLFSSDCTLKGCKSS